MEKNYAVFIDLENCGGKVETLKDVVEKVKIRGDILLGIVYGYNESYSALKELLLSNTFNVVPSLRWGYNQKNNLDIQLVIDAMEVAYINDRIDCFCIVSGDSDYTPLVGKLKSMGKYVLGISRSEVASKVFINACNEFIFLESVSTSAGNRKKKRKRAQDDAPSTPDALNELVEKIIRDQAGTDGFLFASELKKTINRIKPDFNEKNFGYNSFGKLLKMLEKSNPNLELIDDNHALKISLKSDDLSSGKQLNEKNWKAVFTDKLSQFKDDGFSRVNPSIVKASIQSDYPDFDERQIGYNKFSEVMRALEKDNIVRVEYGDSNSMLLKII